MATKITYKEFPTDYKPLFEDYINHSDREKRCFISNETLYVPTDIARRVSCEMGEPYWGTLIRTIDEH